MEVNIPIQIMENSLGELATQWAEGLITPEEYASKVADAGRIARIGIDRGTVYAHELGNH